MDTVWNLYGVCMDFMLNDHRNFYGAGSIVIFILEREGRVFRLSFTTSRSSITKIVNIFIRYTELGAKIRNDGTLRKAQGPKWNDAGQDGEK